MITPWEYFANDPAGGADFLEITRRGTGELLLCTADAVVMREPSSGVILFHAKHEPAARAALEKMPRAGLYAVHGDWAARLVMQKTGCTSFEKCHQARYLRDEAPAPVLEAQMRTLEESFAETVLRHYRGVADPAYTVGRLRAGAVMGAFVDGALAGFIGTHAEGSMGMLEVFPAYRRQGLGFALEAELIRRLLSRGAIPFCHIIDGNEASLRLQRRLGMTFAGELVYWIS